MKIDVEEDLRLSPDYIKNVNLLEEQYKAKLLKDLKIKSEEEEFNKKELISTIEAKLFYKINKQCIEALDIKSHTDTLNYLMKSFPDASKFELHWFLFSCFKIPSWIYPVLFLFIISAIFILIFSVKTFIFTIMVFIIFVVVMNST